MGSGLHARVPPASPCPWVAHPVSGRLVATHRREVAPAPWRPFGLAVAAAPPVPRLSLATTTHSSAHSTKGTPSRLRAPTGRKHMVSGSLSLPSPGCFSPFPHGTGPLSVASGSYALGGGPPGFPPDSACPAVLTCTTHPHAPAVAYGTLTRCGGPFQQPSADWRAQSEASADPSRRAVLPRASIGGSLCHPHGLGSARFARRYSGPPLASSGY